LDSRTGKMGVAPFKKTLFGTRSVSGARPPPEKMSWTVTFCRGLPSVMVMVKGTSAPARRGEMGPVLAMRATLVGSAVGSV
jgi:hypothetical protein